MESFSKFSFTTCFTKNDYRITSSQPLPEAIYKSMTEPKAKTKTKKTTAQSKTTIKAKAKVGKNADKGRSDRGEYQNQKRPKSMADRYR